MSSGQGRTISLLFDALAERARPGAAAEPGDLIFDLDTPDQVPVHAPPVPVFRGSLGSTTRRAARVRSGESLVSIELYVVVNADTDPELGRLARGEAPTPLHALMVGGEPLELAVPFVYHEPSRGLFVLVVPPALRHRELEERIELYRQLAAEAPGVVIPRYVLEAQVVIGPLGLRALRDRLHERARATAEPAVAAAGAPGGSPASPLALDPVEAGRSSAAGRRETGASPESEATRIGFGVAPAPVASSASGAPDPSSPVVLAAPVGTSGSTSEALLAAVPVQPSPASSSPAPSQWMSSGSSLASSPSSSSGFPSGPSSGGVPGAALDADATAATNTAPDAEIPELPEASPAAGASSLSGASSGVASGVPLATLGNSLPGIPIAALAPQPPILPGPRGARRPTSVADAEPSGPLTAPNEALPAIEPLAHGVGAHAIPAAPVTSMASMPSFDPSAATATAEPHRLVRASELELHVGDSGATPDTIDEDLSAGMSRATRQLPPGADPITTEARDQPVYEPDEWLAQVIAAGACDLTVEHGRARVALAASAIGDAEVLRGPLDVRVVLHRADAYPVVVLLFGSPAGLRGDRRDQIAAMCLDVAADRDRIVLSQLARSFEIVLEVFAGGRWLRRVLLSAPLADNVAYVLRAADDYLHGLAACGAELSASRACQQVAHPGHDVTGAHHPEAEHFSDQLLVSVRTAAQLLGALAVAQRFATPGGEDYLVCVRGFPLVRWRRLRRHVLEQAVTWGVWMGGELARVAVSEGMARSRRDLVHRLYEGFELLRQHPAACDLDEAALAANAEALEREAHSLGVVPGKARTLIHSEMDSVVAGTIDLVPSRPRVPVAAQTIDELIAVLDEPGELAPAALELVRRGAERALPAIVAALGRMSRGEAVQVLAASVRLGAAVEGPLITALSSSKAYVRQGAALALGLLRGDDGVAAIVQLLLTEPTEIWREVARALGQVGPQALHHLARTARDRLGAAGAPGTSALVEERMAWALAHLGARDSHKAIVQMASGHSLMAPIASKALALEESAARDHQALVSDGMPQEPTMNRTFSRQFFAAVAGELSDGEDDGSDGADEDALDPLGAVGDELPDHGSQVIAISDARGQRRRVSEDDDL